MSTWGSGGLCTEYSTVHLLNAGTVYPKNSVNYNGDKLYILIPTRGKNMATKTNLDKKYSMNISVLFYVPFYLFVYIFILLSSTSLWTVCFQIKLTLRSSLKYGLQAESSILCAESRFPSTPRVTSTKSFSPKRVKWKRYVGIKLAGYPAALVSCPAAYWIRRKPLPFQPQCYIYKIILPYINTP